MKQNRILFAAILSVGFWLGAEARASDAVNPVYRERAEKIVVTLALAESAQKTRVSDAIVEHYRGTNLIHDANNERIKALKAQESADNKAATAAQIAALREDARPQLAKLHAEFLSRLAADLSPAQIEQVKDGLTYGVLPLTFGVYQQMLPNLTAEQKAQILAFLTEARELAMDAGSSDEKHAWFGKYKGKINNYLAKAGYNMKQAEKELAERNKAAAKK
ncbi:MAG TPA: DUF3826 domain-containing protein [Opitutaceae bacterium]|nr:DUF3826 domain-containing protein [Opitutaceae bacterium]